MTEDYWKHVGRGSYAKYSKWRDMSKIKQPKFKAPFEITSFMRGNSSCDCRCEAKMLPRNTILVESPTPERTYEALKNAWRRNKFGWLAHGSCQIAISKGLLKAPFSEVKEILRPTKLKCFDNIDNTKLKEGDILLTRIGSQRSVGKPHLILEGLK